MDCFLPHESVQVVALAEVEAAFPASGLLRIHRHLLVRLEAVLGLRPALGGRAMVRLLGGGAALSRHDQIDGKSRSHQRPRNPRLPTV